MERHGSAQNPNEGSNISDRSPGAGGLRFCGRVSACNPLNPEPEFNQVQQLEERTRPEHTVSSDSVRYETRTPPCSDLGGRLPESTLKDPVLPMSLKRIQTLSRIRDPELRGKPVPRAGLCSPTQRLISWLSVSGIDGGVPVQVFSGTSLFNSFILS